MSAKNRRGGLGRGLGALIPTAPAEPGEPPDAATEAAAEAAATQSAAPSVGQADPARRDATGRPMGYPPMPPYNAGDSREPGEQTPADASAGGSAGIPEVPTAEAVESVAPAADRSADPGDRPGVQREEADLIPVTGAQFVEIPVLEIRPNPKQPRQVFDEQALAELTHSIREFGVLQPVVVREVDGGYELVMGERRLRAAAQAGLATVPAIVRTTTDDAMLRDALLENIHRAQLNPLEEAAAYQQLLAEFGATHDELATRIGRSRPQVSNTIRLLNLPVPVQRRVAAGVISAGHARALLSVDDGEVQEDLAGRIVAEGLSVRATEELAALHAAGHAAAKPRRRASSPRITAPALSELADRLSDAFDTRVKVELGRTKGKIVIEFATIDDLERIVGVMSGRLAAGGQPGHDFGAAFTAAGAPDPTAAAPNATDATSAGSAEVIGSDYAGWGDDHVPDLGAWNDSIRYDSNES